MNTYSLKLRRLREQLKLKQGDIGDMVGESRQSISQIEGNTRRKFPVEFIRILHDKLDIPYSYWFDEIDYNLSLVKEPENLYKINEETGLKTLNITRFLDIEEANNHIVLLTTLLNNAERDSHNKTETVISQKKLIAMLEAQIESLKEG
jgi:transcriptional regulator with XRE-family HTH domain